MSRRSRVASTPDPFAVLGSPCGGGRLCRPRLHSPARMRPCGPLGRRCAARRSRTAPRRRFLRGPHRAHRPTFPLYARGFQRRGTWRLRTLTRSGPTLGPLDDHLPRRRHPPTALRAPRRAARWITRASPASASPCGRRTPARPSVVGDFNDGTAAATRCASASTAACGRFSPPRRRGRVYKYEIVGVHGALMPLKDRSVRLRLGIAGPRRPRSSPAPTASCGRTAPTCRRGRGRSAAQAVLRLRGPSGILDARGGRPFPHL